MSTSEAVATSESVAEQGRAWMGGRNRKAGARSRNSGPGDAVYGLGMIGALVYFMGTAESGSDRLLAVAKAAVWPALLVHKAFKRLDA